MFSMGDGQMGGGFIKIGWLLNFNKHKDDPLRVCVFIKFNFLIDVVPVASVSTRSMYCYDQLCT